MLGLAVPAASGQQDSSALTSAYLHRGQSREQWLKSIEARAHLRVRQMTSVAALTDDQVDKLMSAVRVDLNHLQRKLQLIEEQNRNVDLSDRQQRSDAYKRMRSIKSTGQEGLTGPGSLFSKVLNSSLSEEQTAKLDADETSRHRYLRASLIRLTITDLERYFPLTSQQRAGLLRLIDDQDTPELTPPVASIYGFLLLSKVNQDDLKTVLDAKQLAVLNQLLQQYRGIALR